MSKGVRNLDRVQSLLHRANCLLDELCTVLEEVEGEFVVERPAPSQTQAEYDLRMMQEARTSVEERLRRLEQRVY